MNAKPLKKKSLPIAIMESELYDWNPGARFLLVTLALGTRKEKEDYSDTFLQADCPYTHEEMVGWCDMAQWRLAARVGKSESQVQRDLDHFVEDGVIERGGWEDNNGAHHNRYQINIAKVLMHQRPEQKKTMKRPKRYKKSNPNRGHFSKTNQPTAKPDEFGAEAVGV